MKKSATSWCSPGDTSLLTQLKGWLRQSGLKAKRGLGQHFLIDEPVLRLIVSAAGLKTDDVVVEVGPGPGILTRELARRAGLSVYVAAQLPPNDGGLSLGQAWVGISRLMSDSGARLCV